VTRFRRLLVAAGLLGALVSARAVSRASDGDGDSGRTQVDNAAYPEAFRRRVNDAIDRAAHWLLRTQAPDGSWTAPFNTRYPMGPTALATLAALHAGVPADNPRVVRAFAYLRTLPMRRTYSVALLLMALDAKYGPATDAFAKEETDRYGNRVQKTPCADHISKEDLAWMREGVKFLVDAQNSDGTWRYPEGGFDLSNTQYALLGLKAASRCDVKIPRRVWEDALRAHLSLQEQEGPEVAVRVNEVRGDYRVEWTERAHARGFGYTGQMAATGSMTTAGLSGLLICQSELWSSRHFGGRSRQQTRDAIRDGFAWLQVHYTVDENPVSGAAWHYYYLYGLERAGVLSSTRFVGGHDWYLDGALDLLEDQEREGSWHGQQLVDTCFAILFLKRASFRASNPAITPP
jgi:Prenyltransferase and squalene oxidase repeat